MHKHVVRGLRGRGFRAGDTVMLALGFLGSLKHRQVGHRVNSGLGWWPERRRRARGGIVGHRDVPVDDHVGTRSAGRNREEKRSNEHAPERRQDARSPGLCPRLRAHRDFVLVGSDGAVNGAFLCHVSFLSTWNNLMFVNGFCFPWITPDAIHVVSF